MLELGSTRDVSIVGPSVGTAVTPVFLSHGSEEILVTMLRFAGLAGSVICQITAWEEINSVCIPR